MSSSALTFFLILNAFSLLEPSEALKCRLYHKIHEEGHILRINPAICQTSSNYCVVATYSDPDETKKNGFSMGCDKVDCQGIDNVMYTGWRKKPDGMICRKSRDYGKKGEICCCTGDMCNTSNSIFNFMFFIFSIIFYLYC